MLCKQCTPMCIFTLDFYICKLSNMSSMSRGVYAIILNMH